MKTAAIQNQPQQTQTYVLALGVGGLISLLVAFKLYRHFTLPWLGAHAIHAEVLSVIGFSYFILKTIGFLHVQSLSDAKDAKEGGPWTVLSYGLFPPTITSGPIQRYLDFKQQVCSPEPLSFPLLLTVGYRLARGYFRKVVVAYVLYETFNRVSVGELNLLTSTLSVTLLYLYFYFDFAGYPTSQLRLGS